MQARIPNRARHTNWRVGRFLACLVGFFLLVAVLGLWGVLIAVSVLAFIWVKRRSTNTGFNPKKLPDDGHAFEHWVADAFTKFGWTAWTTSGSGDQGIDVIIEKAGRKIGIQVKLYATPVGNSAVQAAFAGQRYYQLDGAAVLATAGFTPSAQQLADATHVILMSQFDIPDADRIFGIWWQPTNSAVRAR